MKSWISLFILLGAGPLQAQEAPSWRNEPAPAADIRLAEPAPDEVVIVVNDNALGGNHAGLFAGAKLIDPAGSYVWTRSRDKAWPGPTLADYARYQTVDGPKIRFYRFHLQPQTFATIAPTALGHVLDALTHGKGAVGECQKLDASPC